MYLGLGSNLGNKEENLRKAISMINEQIGTVVRQSAFFYSEPWGYESDNQFVNAVILVETSLSPYDVLTANQRIEHLLGKTQAHATERPSDLPSTTIGPLTSISCSMTISIWMSQG